MRRPHDRALLDALGALAPTRFAGEVWRIARSGRDPLLPASSPGRWNPGPDAPVLYTSLERDGALAEIGYRLGLEPVWPNRLAHTLHRLAVRTRQTLRLAEPASLAPLGVDIARCASLDYAATQAIAATADFLEFDGLLVPSAHAPCLNLVLFTARIAARALVVRDSTPIDWPAWRAAAGRGRVAGASPQG